MGNRLTNFPGGLTSFGIPVIPGGIPFGKDSKVFFVAPNSGGDSNPGTLARPLATLSAAHTKMRANKNDVCFLIAESNSASSTSDYQSSTLTWSKDLCHLIGIGAPSKFSNRSRIAQLSTATSVSPLVNVTADGCYFANFSMYHGVDDANSLIGWQDTGVRNVYDNIHFAGIGHATMVAAGAASLKLNGAEETLFRNCVVGLDTISRDQNVEGELWFDGTATRITFEHCLINAYISNAGYSHVTVQDGTAIDRGIYFDDCLFMAKSTNKGVTQTSVMSIPAGISQGAIVLRGGTGAFSDGGAVDWDSNDRGVIWNFAAAAEASAAGGILTNQ